ncbi:MAG: hypothetical protein EBU88_20480, partial [Acidobacteria bacterium]|nr:hypothetical protein [Acidobacteriota bacterium]
STPTGVTGISSGISFSPSSVTLGSTAAAASSTATLDISTLGLTQGTLYYALCRATFTSGGTTTTNDVWVKFTAGTAANGSGSLTVGSQSGTATYAGAADNVTFLVDATRNSNGTFNGTYSVSGLPSGVTSSFSTTSFTSSGSNAFPDPTLTLTVGSTVPAGSYQFTVTCTPSNSGSVAFMNTGTLLVQRAGLTIAANNLTKTYGDTLTLDNTTPGDFAVTGLSNSDTVTSVTLTSSGTDATANVGSYSIVPSAAIGSGLSNYDITYNNGSLSVQKRAVTIIADAKSKIYADANPTLTATEGNTVAGAAALQYTLATTAGQFSNVGSYPISITLGSNPNY